MNSIPVLTIEDVATLDGVLADFLKKAEADLNDLIDLIIWLHALFPTGCFNIDTNNRSKLFMHCRCSFSMKASFSRSALSEKGQNTPAHSYNLNCRAYENDAI